MIAKQKPLFNTFTTNVGRFTSIRFSGMSGAEFSSCGSYRYSLWRFWDEDPDRPRVMFIGLNPSTADATRNDPTIRRCMSFAKKWGFGGMFMVNAYAYRSTDPKQIRHVTDPVGPFNDNAMRYYRLLARKVVAAWGSHCDDDRASRVCNLIEKPIECFGINANGSPKHPLYLHSHRSLESFWRPA